MFNAMFSEGDGMRTLFQQIDGAYPLINHGACGRSTTHGDWIVSAGGALYKREGNSWTFKQSVGGKIWAFVGDFYLCAYTQGATTVTDELEIFSYNGSTWTSIFFTANVWAGISIDWICQFSCVDSNNFISSATIDGDDWFVVGNPNLSVGSAFLNYYQGAVAIFKRSGGSWSRTQYFHNAGIPVNRKGMFVNFDEIDGTLHTLERAWAGNDGKLLTYKLSGGTWTEVDSFQHADLGFSESGTVINVAGYHRNIYGLSFTNGAESATWNNATDSWSIGGYTYHSTVKQPNQDDETYMLNGGGNKLDIYSSNPAKIEVQSRGNWDGLALNCIDGIGTLPDSFYLVQKTDDSNNDAGVYVMYNYDKDSVV